MTWKSLLEKTKNLITSVVDKQQDISNNTENLDAKIVFQDTKKSLETLKQNIFSSTDEAKKKEQEQHLSQYIDRLLWFSVLSQHDKTFLNQLKQNISAKTLLQETDLESIITIVSHLEQKAEHLDEVDQEKVKELHDTLSQHKKSLDLLKKGVAVVAPTLDEAKKKAFETMKKDLEKHRWSSWLAQPVYDYLVDKHINKKPVSKFKEFLIGTVGLTVVGWFVGKDIKNLIANIDTLKVEDIVGKVEEKVEEAMNTLAHLSKEKFEKEKDRFEFIMYNFFEKKFWKKMDREKFKRVSSDWFNEWKSKIALWDKANQFNEALFQWNWEFDLFWETAGLLIAPPKAIFDLFIKMKNEWLISLWDIMIDWILLPSWKAVLNLWIWSVWLFTNTMKTVFTSMSVNDLSEYIKEHNDRLDVDSKMALWWLLYRRWWWFWNLAGHLWTLVWEGMSTLFMQRSWNDIGKVSAYRKWWVMSNFQKELQVFEQLEKWLINTWIFKELKTKSGASILDDITWTMKKNLAIFDIMQNNKTFSSIESALKKNWFDDVLSELKNSIHWQKDLGKIKTVAGNVIETNMNKSLFIAEDSFSTWRKFFGNKVKLPWSKFPYEVELIDKMKDFSKLQWKMLQEDAMFNNVKNLFRRFSKGKQLAGMVEYADEVKFALNNVDDAKMFFDNIKTIWRHSPEILKTLFKGFPLIMMWREMMDKFWDPNNEDSSIKIIRDWLMYLTPIVGPIKLISDWITIKDWQFASLSSAGIGLWLVTLDWYFAIKAASKKEFIKFMTMPIRDSVSFVKSLWKWTYLWLKTLADGVRIIRAGKTAELGVESLKFLKSSWIKIAWAAFLCYLGYLGYNEFFDWASDEEKKQFAEIEKMDKKALEEKIQKDWPSMDDKQKSALIKFATIHRMGLSDFDQVEANKNWNNVSIRFSTLVNYKQMKDVEHDLQQSLSFLEATKDIDLNYSLDWWKVKYQLLAMKERKYIDENWIFKQQEMKNYILTMWYPENIAIDLMKKIA